MKVKTRIANAVTLYKPIVNQMMIMSHIILILLEKQPIDMV
jgi:hypothetical protein